MADEDTPQPDQNAGITLEFADDDDDVTPAKPLEEATLSFASNEEEDDDDDFFSLFEDVHFSTPAVTPTPPTEKQQAAKKIIAHALNRPITRAEINFCLSRWVAISISNPAGTPKTIPTVTMQPSGWILVDYGNRLLTGPGINGRLAGNP